MSGVRADHLQEQRHPVCRDQLPPPSWPSTLARMARTAEQAGLGNSWKNLKAKTKKKVKDIAKALIALYARRQAAPAAFARTGTWAQAGSLVPL